MAKECICGWSSTDSCCEVMRRPTFCNNTIAAEAQVPPRPSEKEEGRLSRVKRMLTTSLLMGRHPPVTKTFAVHLDELPITGDGIPRIVVRMALFIETYGFQVEGLFRLSGGNPRLVERLKCSIDRTGDADFEGCGDVTSVASLLKIWLRDLPEPVVPAAVTAELVTLLNKYGGELDWCEGAREVLDNLPARNGRLLQYILQLLHHYNLRHADKGYQQSLAAVFSPLLLCGEFHGIATPDTTHLMAKLIAHYGHIYSDRLLDHTPSMSDSSEVQALSLKTPLMLLNDTGRTKQRKRKDRHGNDAQSLDRKFVRSNSEERPYMEEKKVGGKESIRRVSSHEDFSRSRHSNYQNSCIMELIAESVGTTEGLNVNQPLHEHNSSHISIRNGNGNKLRNNNNNNNSNNNNNNNNNNSVDNKQISCNKQELTRLIDNEVLDIPPVCAVGYASDLFDENEHERRRHSERFAPQRGHRNVVRRRKSLSKSRRIIFSDDQDGGGSSSKENEEEQNVDNFKLQAPLSDDESSLPDTPGSLSRSSSSTSCHSFLQLHSQERDRSPSPTATPMATTPPLDLATLHQQVDATEPLTSWSIGHRQPQLEDKLSSPRNSIVMSRRVFSSSSDEPLSHYESQVIELSKQIHSLKRKLKRYEEGFEREFGYRPSHADKIANPDTKKMCTLLNKLRKDLKQFKEDGGNSTISRVVFAANDQSGSSVPSESSVTGSLTEEIIHDIETRLTEKRVAGGRPEKLEDMTREQLLQEKVAVQKGLLHLEGTYGRPTSKEERDIVRPLYDRYRTLKRLLARNALSKLKDSVSELGTILEHETMDFTSASPPPPAASPSPSLTTCIASASPVRVDSPPPLRPNTPDLWENLHALPMSELVVQQKATREEKKRLRRSLREFEEECQNRTGRKLLREDRLPMEQTYIQYKHAKAKLRLLEALLTKKK